MISPKLRTAVILGGIGWLLLPFPQVRHLYSLIASGHVIESLYVFFGGGHITQAEVFDIALLGMLIGAFAAAAAFLAIYIEASGSSSTTVRRVASFVAAVLMLTSAAAVIWRDLFSGALPPQGYTVSSLRAGAIMNCVFFCSWALLFVVFTATRFPFRSSFTRVIAGLTATEAALFVAVLLYSIWDHWSSSRFAVASVHPLADAIALSPWVLMIGFLVATVREAAAFSAVEPEQF